MEICFQCAINGLQMLIAKVFCVCTKNYVDMSFVINKQRSIALQKWALSAQNNVCHTEPFHLRLNSIVTTRSLSCCR